MRIRLARVLALAALLAALTATAVEAKAHHPPPSTDGWVVVSLADGALD